MTSPDLTKQLRYVHALMMAGGFQTPTEFARAAGLTPSTLNKKIAGTDQTLLSARTLLMLEKAVKDRGCDISGTTTDASFTGTLSTISVKVIGAVQAGEWLEAMEWPTDDQYDVPLPAEYRQNMPLFALKVRGPSMNKIYGDGTIIICKKLIDLDRDPVDGERVVVQRNNPNGLVEATVKTLRIDANGNKWLWPESDHPAHQTPVQINHTDDVQMTALVVLHLAQQTKAPWK